MTSQEHNSTPAETNDEQVTMNAAPLVPLMVHEVMQSSYLNYAMSVIMDRALPDVRDGLKPVHRRILYAMHGLGITPGSAYKKSARVAGEVIGKYHPHGDKAVYDAAVVLSQPWVKRMPLIDGQGNFGSMDGDNPAAPRYTEMRTTKAGHAFFDDLEKNTVNFHPNYDGAETEPEVLPVPYPQLWINGSEGIAVGMATSIPPHNPAETLDATLALLDDPYLPLDAILSMMPGPDFPTGGTVYELSGYREALVSGRGRVRIRSKWHVETPKKGHEVLVLDELPYQTNKKTLIEDIAEKAKDGLLPDITDVRDESNKDGVRVVIELRKGSIPAVVFNHLIKARTGVESAFSYNVMALDGQEPRQMGFVDIIKRFLAFRHEIVTRRTQYDLDKAIARLHILEALMKAVGALDETIALIRSHADAKSAHAALKARFDLDDVQAQAILDLKLQRLTGLEIEALQSEYASVHASVLDMRDILAKPSRLTDIVRDDLRKVREKFASNRLTEISYETSSIDMADLIKKEPCLIHRTHNGYIKRMALDTLNPQNRNTKGKSGIQLDDDDVVEAVYSGSTHDTFMVFTKTGRVLARRVWQIPEGTTSQRGRHLRNLFEDLEEDIATILFVPEMEIPGLSVITVTAQGKVKRTDLEEYRGASRRMGIQGVSLEEGDRLVASVVGRDHDHVMLVSSGGKCIRFEINDDNLRALGRTSMGVRGLRMEDGETIVGAMILPGDGKPRQIITVKDDDQQDIEVLDTASMDEGVYLLCMGARGVGKRTPVSEFRVQHRFGKGVLCFKINTKTGPLVQASLVRDDEDLVLTTPTRSLRIRIRDVRVSSRATAGTLLMDVGTETLGDILVVPGFTEDTEKAAS